MGTSASTAVTNALEQDHPHAYGDKDGCNGDRSFNKGSSPRVWGQVSSTIWYEYPVRIIPTRMGTSACAFFLFRRAEDHPHAYGDKYKKLTARSAAVGSSPRVWGQDRNRNPCGVSARIIPTRMGTSAILCTRRKSF